MNRTACLHIIGFYIARHPWLDRAGFVKVGCTVNLATRLNMASFITCFTPEWHFAATFHCKTLREAFLLEQSVLYILREYRIPQRELVRMDSEKVIQIASAASHALKVASECHISPTYSAENETKASSTQPSSHTTKQPDTNSSKADSCELTISNLPSSDSNHSASSAETETPGASAAHARMSTPRTTVVPLIRPYLKVLNEISPTNVSTVSNAHRSRSERDSLESCITSPDPVLANGGAANSADMCVEMEKMKEVVFPSSINGNDEYDETFGDLAEFAFDSNIGLNGEGSMLPSLLGNQRDAGYSFEGLREYQKEAVERCQSELNNEGKTICQMACRCGKTPVAFTLMMSYLAVEHSSSKGPVALLYLVPGLELLRQTAKKLDAYGLRTAQLVLIGSRVDGVWLEGSKTTIYMSTEGDTLRQTVHDSMKEGRSVVIISTYHSAPLALQLGLQYALTVFDECHRICGSASPSRFNHVLLSPPTGHRLFMTATPTYDTPIKMGNRHLFGSTAFRYYLREGIDAAFVNPFAVRVILGESLEDMNPYIHEAMRLVNKLLVFCRDIKHAEQLAICLKRADLPPGVAPFSVYVAHSRMGGEAVAKALGSFSNADGRCILFNVRLFQEGVEIPDLNAVFFASPRYSPRDIIQSVCRPLNRKPGKPPSYVFLPAALNKQYSESHPVNLNSFSTLIPFTDALMDEDPKLFEYLIDPQKTEYDIDVLGVRTLKLTSERVRKFVLPALRRGVRFSSHNSDRLHRAARMPWKRLFSELRRIVDECNRYPKANDAWVVGETSISMYMFYMYARRGYMQHVRGEESYLQAHQIRDLESLKEWSRYGVHGPYPWPEAMATLEAHLQEHGTVPPLDVHKGGYVGLDATPFERLCGILMHVNQSDAHSSLRLIPEKQEMLDKLCSKYNIEWRKRRNAKGDVLPHASSFITRSYEQFKYLFDQKENYPWFQRYLDVHFPGYPEKHSRMEDPKTLASGLAPPRRNPVPRPKKRNCDQNSSPENDQVHDRKAADAPQKKQKRATKKTKTTNHILLGETRNVGDEVTKPPMSTVQCRVCRCAVSPAKWDEHVASAQHQQLLR